MKKHNSFSLVEMIVLIAVAAILIGVVSPMVTSYIVRSKTDSCVQTRQAVTAAYKTYMSQRAAGSVTPQLCNEALTDAFNTVLETRPATGDRDATDGSGIQYENICKGGGIYTCRIDAASGQLTITCSAEDHGAVAISLGK